ncbi:MAG: phage terminase large subunit, partial [Clostridia bacterium]|nr:phage terminase large subunit [Clostridia bacterium]
MEQIKRRKEAPIFEKLRREVPNPRQQEFFRSTARYTAYGGARGGGKSFAMRRKMVLLAMRYPKLRLLLLRRTLQELRENHLLPLQSDLNGYAEYKKEERSFLFPNGSRLTLGYCDCDSDLLQYQGAEYDVIGFEEATHFKEDWMVFISTSLRTTKKDFSPRIYYTCNPGGVGHAYIKRLFIDRRFREGEDPDDYRFIPATVYDNHALMEADPDYVKRLEALPEHKRRAHLDGDWNVFEGQVFEELRIDPAHFADRCFTHAIDPFTPLLNGRSTVPLILGMPSPFRWGGG